MVQINVSNMSILNDASLALSTVKTAVQHGWQDADALRFAGMTLDEILLDEMGDRHDECVLLFTADDARRYLNAA